MAEEKLVALFEKLEARLEASLAKTVEAAVEKRIGAMEHFDSKESLKGGDDDGAEPVVIELDAEVKDKRSANEIAVLEKIVGLATLEDSTDARELKKKLMDVQLEARKRIFLLELVDRVGWGVALAYQELYPKDLAMAPSRLKEAADYYEVMASFKAKKAAKKIAIPRRPGTAEKPQVAAEKRKPDFKFGACFKCGGNGHWAKECPGAQKKSQ
jgi:hypothetical protein